jgi:tRNA-dihydrouridine synthase 1
MSEEKKDDSLPPISVDRQWIVKLLKQYPNPNAMRHDKALVVAPMVDQSDLPFRLLARKYGSNLCFTPMIHSRLLVTMKNYRKKFMVQQLHMDRPLIAQLCGSDPDYVLQAARILEPYVDGIDINCGCPQNIARRGNYGAFLLEQEETLLTLVNHLVKHLRVPLSVKVRLLPPHNASQFGDDPRYHRTVFDIPKHSLELYGKLVDAGIHLLTIHGRTRHEKQHYVDKTDWETIGKAVKIFGDRIPIFANGSIETSQDVDACLNDTGADGIMSSESILEYPPLFFSKPQYPVRTIGRIQIAKEYLALARKYPPHIGGQGSDLKCVRVHIHRFLHADLQADPDLRQVMVSASSLDALEAAVDLCQRYHDDHNHKVCDERLSWYRRHREDHSLEGKAVQQTETVAKRPKTAQDNTENKDYKEEQTFCGLFGSDQADY